MATKMSALQVASNKGSKSSSSEDKMPCRPAFGNKGTEVTLWANYFTLDVETPSLYKYSIKATLKKEGKDPPEAKGMKLHACIKLALDQVAKGVSYATEFKAQVISLGPLRLPDNNIVEVPYSDEGKHDVFLVKFDPAPDVDMDALRSYIQTMALPPGKDSDKEKNKFPRFAEHIDAISIITGYQARESDQVGSVGRSRYFPLDLASEINSLGYPDNNTVIRGYFQSARPATGRLLLNANVSHGVFRPSGEVVKLMNSIGFNNLQNLSKTLSGLRCWCKVLAEKPAPGSKKGAKQSEERRIKKVTAGLARKSDGSGENPVQVSSSGAGPSDVRFFLSGPAPPGLKADSYCTVSDYYFRKYGFRPNNQYPVLKFGTNRPIYFPAELVEVIPGQVLRRKTTPDETAQMILFACRSPWANATSLTSVGRKVLGLDGNKKLTEFKVTAGKELLTVKGRELLAPDVAYLDSRTNKRRTIKTSEGSWNMRDVKVVRAGRPISKWAMINVDIDGYGGDHKEVTIAVEKFVKFMSQMGIAIAHGATHVTKTDIPRSANPLVSLRQTFQGFRQAPPQFIFVVLPGNKTDTTIYNAVKYLGDVEFGCPTVCVLRKNIIKSQPQYFANVALKVNLKMGGANHKLGNDVRIVKDGKTMVVGYDVTHPTNVSGSTKGLPSLVGMVSSVDQDLAQWPAASWSQAGKLEMLDANLEAQFAGRLTLWRSRNKGQLPQNIIIYRDGVSEGQFDQVLDIELPMMRAACTATYPPNQQPKIAIVVSVKRHQTRFFPTDPNHMTSKSRNINSGTVVDRGVTQATVWDFFLTAHQALQGTARPAHYTVLLDEVFRSTLGAEAANGLEAFTHELCYLFGRATKAVSICPPAYYADIVCTRQRVYVADYFDHSDTQSTTSSTVSVPSIKIHPNLQDTMYYI
ncbi:Piwi-domain-containing protein [Jackrogersella minutella]|nr:Piwi-domain-containing protein [Jackrogersella minutella]